MAEPRSLNGDRCARQLRGALRRRFFLLTGACVAVGAVGGERRRPRPWRRPGPAAPARVRPGPARRDGAFTTTLLGTFLGPIGLPITTLVLLTVGNATSGAVIGADLLPAGARQISALLPPGAAVRAIADLSYFNGAHLAGPVITLALWAAGAGILLALRPRLMRRRTATA
ncbi:hypothetical protein ACH4U5_39060 [Streptomyces sp. NPDC020858]|uniref:hypothetical protein n=1 Tax=Streptomyces sp. NPDC020858 TaxID=3365097 RepID=UPI00379EC048